jgi:hypothetical protein
VTARQSGFDDVGTGDLVVPTLFVFVPDDPQETQADD